jgi:hypothetical protein
VVPGTVLDFLKRSSADESQISLQKVINASQPVPVLLICQMCFMIRDEKSSKNAQVWFIAI